MGETDTLKQNGSANEKIYSGDNALQNDDVGGDDVLILTSQSSSLSFGLFLLTKPVDEGQPPASADGMLETTLSTSNLDNGGLRGSQIHRRALGLTYMGGMSVLGIVVIGMETNLVDIAALCNVSVQTVSIALILRSVGSVLGSFSSACLMLKTPPHYLVFVFVALMGLLLLAVPFTTNDMAVDAIFGGFGFAIPVTQAAIQFLTCQVFKDKAGPWLQGNSLAMSAGTVLVPTIHYYLGMTWGYAGLAALAGVLSLLGFLCRPPAAAPAPAAAAAPADPQEAAAAAGGSKKAAGGATRVDYCIGFMLFWIAGCIVSTTSYLKSYIPDVGLGGAVEPDALLAVFMVLCIAGQLVALALQAGMGLRQLRAQMSLLFGFGMLSMVVVLAFPSSKMVLWISILIYGFCVGPLYGYVFDLWNRSTEVTEMGSAVVIFGVAGSGVFSYLTHTIWLAVGSCSVLMVVNGLSFAVAWVILAYMGGMPGKTVSTEGSSLELKNRRSFSHEKDGPARGRGESYGIADHI